MSETAARPLLMLENVVAGYDGLDVLQDLSMTVNRKEITAIIGPNGHGKTTMTRVVTGMLPLRKGRVSFKDKRIDGKGPQQIRGLGLALVPQGDLLFPRMNVLENLLLGSFLIRDKAEASRRLDKVYTLLPRLHERRHQRADTLSGGERRMLAIGRAFAGSCDLLIVDEPSLGLAPKVVDEVYAALATIAAEALGVIIVEENTARVAGMADRVFLIDEGRVAWQGGAGEIASASDVVSSYLGA